MTENLENEAQASSSESMSSDSDWQPPTDLVVDGGNTDVQDKSQDETQASENSESEKSETENIDNSDDSAESSQTGEGQTQEEPEKIVLTKAELDAEQKKIREIAERKAKRDAEREFKARQEQSMQMQAQNPPQQQAYGQPGVQPSPSHIWVPELGQWVDSNQSIADFMNQAAQPQITQQPHHIAPNIYQQNQMPQQQAAQPAQQQPEFSENVYSQRDDCSVRISDFNDVMRQAPLTPQMVEAACTDKDGMKNLYQMTKDAPHELFQIAKLPAHEQQHRMWLMNEKFKSQKAEKLKTKATKQAAPLNNTGEVSKPENGLSLEELKKKRFNQYWDSN